MMLTQTALWKVDGGSYRGSAGARMEDVARLSSELAMEFITLCAPELYLREEAESKLKAVEERFRSLAEARYEVAFGSVDDGRFNLRSAEFYPARQIPSRTAERRARRRGVRLPVEWDRPEWPYLPPFATMADLFCAVSTSTSKTDLAHNGTPSFPPLDPMPAPKEIGRAHV